MVRDGALKYTIGAAVAAVSLLSCGAASATTFTFSDEYYITGTSLAAVKTSALNKFGTSNGVTLAGAGVYQGNGTCVVANPSYSPYRPAVHILRVDNQYVRAPPLLARPRFRPYLGGVEG